MNTAGIILFIFIINRLHYKNNIPLILKIPFRRSVFCYFSDDLSECHAVIHHQLIVADTILFPVEHFQLYLYLITLFCIGEVVGFEPDALNGTICAFCTHRVSEVSNNEIILSDDELLPVLFVTRYLLDSVAWKVFTKTPSQFPVDDYFDLNKIRNNKCI